MASGECEPAILPRRASQRQKTGKSSTRARGPAEGSPPPGYSTTDEGERGELLLPPLPATAPSPPAPAGTDTHTLTHGLTHAHARTPYRPWTGPLRTSSSLLSRSNVSPTPSSAAGQRARASPATTLATKHSLPLFLPSIRYLTIATTLRDILYNTSTTRQSLLHSLPFFIAHTSYQTNATTLLLTLYNTPTARQSLSHFYHTLTTRQ